MLNLCSVNNNLFPVGWSRGAESRSLLAPKLSIFPCGLNINIKLILTVDTQFIYHFLPSRDAYKFTSKVDL